MPTNDIYKLLGQLSAEVANLKKGQDEMKSEMKIGVDAISGDTAEMVRRIDALDRDMRDHKQKLDDDVMPTVAEVKRWKQRGIGAIAMAGMGGTAIGVSLASGFQKFMDIMQGLGKP